MIILDKLVTLLKEKGLTISTMESCTGGGVSNAITNISGASDVIEFSAVTYSNRFKEKMGVPHEIIEKYSVYSMETADAMSKAIAEFSSSSIGVGITGKLNRVDKNNLYGDDNGVFISIYDSINDKYINKKINVNMDTRELNKKLVIDTIVDMTKTIIK